METTVFYVQQWPTFARCPFPFRRAPLLAPALTAALETAGGSNGSIESDSEIALVNGAGASEALEKVRL